MKTFDLVIVGWGKGGKTLAAAAASRGESVAVVERDPGMYGGTCINTGCIPSKSLVISAERGKWCAQNDFTQKAQYYRASMAEKRRLTAFLRDKMFHKLADHPGVEIFDGVGSFTAPRELAVTGAGRTVTITGRRVVIDTGASPVVPDIAGIRDNPLVFTSRGLLEKEELPRRLLIIGGGYIGLEFASIYAGFGSEVTVVQRGDTFLPHEDRDLAEAIGTRLNERGVKIVTGFRPTAVENREGAALLTGVAADGSIGEYTGEAVLVAVGRHPNTAELGLERAGIKLTPGGGIAVDEYLRTGVPGIWAVGDVVGGMQFTYISLDDSRIVAPQLFGGEVTHSTAGRQNVPHSVFLDPPYSRIGLNEQEARERGIAVKIARLPVVAVPKAQILRETSGMLKAVIEASTGRILGAMLLCPQSHELINQIRLAMECDIPYTALRDGIYTHPTMSEAFNDWFDI